MTETELALRKAIIAFPAEDTPRLALADHYDETNQPERAEFVRTQMAISRLDPQPPVYLGYGSRLADFSRIGHVVSCYVHYNLPGDVQVGDWVAVGDPHLTTPSRPFPGTTSGPMICGTLEDVSNSVGSGRTYISIRPEVYPLAAEFDRLNIIQHQLLVMHGNTWRPWAGWRPGTVTRPRWIPPGAGQMVYWHRGMIDVVKTYAYDLPRLVALTTTDPVSAVCLLDMPNQQIKRTSGKHRSRLHGMPWVKNTDLNPPTEMGNDIPYNDRVELLLRYYFPTVTCWEDQYGRRFDTYLNR